jgi:DNA mismatch repair protein MutS2
MFELPDLLSPRSVAGADPRLLEELLEMSFLGADPGCAIDDALETAALPASTWNAEFFADGLFLPELIEEHFRVTIGGQRFPVHGRYLRAVLGRPPVELETIRFRQDVLRELETDGEIRARAFLLFRRLFDLLTLFKTPGSAARLDQASFRLDLLRHAKGVIDAMADDFAGAASGLHRLHEAGRGIRDSREHRLLSALLDHEERLAELSLRVRLGADGRIRRLIVSELAENEGNPFHKPPATRWYERLNLLWRGYDLDRREVVNRLIVGVYLEVAPALRSLLQVLGQLEVYLGAFSFAERARARGLDVCLAAPAADGRLALERLFNPLLMDGHGRPTPCAIATERPAATVVVTGPNSGGKTRLLQAVGLAQILGQSGLYVPAREARVPILQGLFVSLVEPSTAHESEGRLGAELVRIRRLFEEVRPRTMVLLDELCSGTNPSEAVEIFSLVLDLLRRLDPVAFVTTHFLDFSRRLAEEPPGEELEFIQAVMGSDHLPSYQFAPGVADTSLAVQTASRLGVTFDGLAELLASRFGIRAEPRMLRGAGVVVAAGARGRPRAAGAGRR